MPGCGGRGWQVCWLGNAKMIFTTRTRLKIKPNPMNSGQFRPIPSNSGDD
jgi:hypothetical protein